MRKLFGPLEIFLTAAAVGSAVFSQPLIMVLAIIALVVSLGIKSNAHVRSSRADSQLDDLNPEARTLVRPVMRLVQDIENIVAENKDSSAVKVIGGQALDEAKKIREHCINMLNIRAQVKKTLQGEYEAQKSVDQIQEQLQIATTDQERQSLESALAARKLELDHYKEQANVLGQIETTLKQSEAALSEMKARLSVAATASVDTSQDTELNETILRLQSLSSSFDEAEDVLRERVR